MRVRVGAEEFPIKSAELTYIRVPNGTIKVALEIEAKRDEGLRLSLYPSPLPGRALADLTGQVQLLASPTAPDRYEPRAVNVVAGIYVGSHEAVFDNRIEWGHVDERGIALHWTGAVGDLDAYNSTTRHPLVVDATVAAVERPHRYAFSYMTYAQPGESPRLDAVKERVVKSLDETLAARRWFEGMPFVAVEVVVRVEAKGRAWPALPPLRASEPPFVVAKLPRALVMRGDDESLQRALDAEIADGLAQLEKRYRQPAPSFL
jgi:hypothetical protein